MATNLTLERLKEVYEYLPESGLFIRKLRTYRHKAGEVAGTLLGEGYIQIGIGGKQYRAHRLAFFYMTGAWPELEIDHVNGERSDNRWENLREANRFQNSWNKKKSKANTSGYKGVSWDNTLQRYRASIRVNGKGIYLGVYTDPKLAGAAYIEAAQYYFGEYHQH